MKIVDSNIMMESQHSFNKYSEIKERLSVWNDKQKVDIENENKRIEFNNSGQRIFSADVLKKNQKIFNTYPDLSTNLESKKSSDLSEKNNMINLPPKLQIMKAILEKIFGIKIDIVDLEGEKADSNNSGPVENVEENENSEKMQGWGIDYHYSEINYEKEEVSFKSAGSIKTENGNNIDFDISFLMSNEKYEKTELSFKAGDALIDPLAVNYDGHGVKLSDDKYEFDLNMDGEKEKISFLSEGSGFLVLDKNNNGMVDDGSELFGPATNDGFLELKEYDEDKNSWIDENDLIYYDLSLWTKDESGNDMLSSLKDNVGAIYLDSVDTKFNLKDGQLKESGIYLSENGTVGLIQEVDLLIETFA